MALLRPFIPERPWYGHLSVWGDAKEPFMQRGKITALVVAVILAGGILVVRNATTQTTTPRLKVAATVFPLYDLVRNVAAPADEVVLLLPPGASPHTFDPRPGTIRALTGSHVLFAIGHGLDDWATRVAQGANVKRSVVVDRQLTLHASTHTHHNHGQKPRRHTAPRHPEPSTGMDPHYWLSIPNAIQMVHTITETLGTLTPAAKEEYWQRAAAYTEQLRQVDAEIRQRFANLPRRHFATFHAAFGYFAEAYGLQVVATFETSPGQEPTPRHVEGFLERIRAHQIRVLFVEPQLPQASLQSLARDLGLTLTELDPVGGGTGRDSYIAMMRFNAAQIATALRE